MEHDKELEARLFAHRRGFFGPNKLRQSRLHGLFIYPPFSIWNTAEGPWLDRRRGWIKLGIQSEVGRSTHTYGSVEKGGAPNPINGGTSVFDPVICELVYRWWCKPGGQIIDPFAGGSVRGIVASLLGYKYWGCDLSEKQVVANQTQLPICEGSPPPQWSLGDATDLLPTAPRADMVFSCPPYGNLERYSDNPADLSTMDYPAFLKAYRRVIALAAERLRNNRFACFVVANFRNRETGELNDFMGDTVRAFRKAGLLFYNDITLLNSRGTAPLRTNNTFLRGHGKVVKVHQNVLVFLKGDARKALASSDVRR